MRTAIFPGSFDPVTNGHLDVIRRAAPLFDALVVAVLVNADKRGSFPVQQREEMLRRVTADLPNVRVENFSGLLVAFAGRCGAQVILRGLRGVEDFGYEGQMAQLNRGMSPGVQTLFMLTAPEYAHISSSRVREIAVLGGDIAPLVPVALRAEISATLRPQGR